MTLKETCTAGLAGLVLIGAVGLRAEQAPPKTLKPEIANLTAAGPNRPDEPYARTLSLAKTRRFLDEMAVSWVRVRQCGTCHTVGSYMLGRGLLGPPTPAVEQVRRHFETRVAGWDTMGDVTVPPFFVDGPKNKGWGNVWWWPAEVVVTSVVLAANDAATTRTLHPSTRKAFERMWSLQRPDGGWLWVSDNFPPFEGSEYFGAALAAVGVGTAPENYVMSPEAQEGLKVLRTYLVRHRDTAVLHDRIFLLWASNTVSGLLGPSEREALLAELLAKQRADGGWSLPSLGRWSHHDGHLNDPVTSPSDGYGTGLVTYVLRESGLPATHPAIVRAVDWLKTNQRESGRWYTRSLNLDTYHFISHAGTVFAALALQSCGIDAGTD